MKQMMHFPLRGQRHNRDNSFQTEKGQSTQAALRKIFHEKQDHLNNSFQFPTSQQANIYVDDRNLTPQRQKYQEIQTFINMGTEGSYQSAISPINSHFSPSNYDLNQTDYGIHSNAYNQLENTKSGFSGTCSAGGGTSIMNDIRYLIAKQDQAIQSKLQQLTDFKDTMTNSLKVNQHGLPSKDSFHKTKNLEGTYNNYRDSTYKYEKENRQQTSQFDFKDTLQEQDPELQNLRTKYDALDFSKKERASQRHNSQGFKELEEQLISPKDNQTNKSFETFNIGSYNRKYKYDKDEKPQDSSLNSSKKFFISKIISKQSQPDSLCQDSREEEYRKTNNTEQDEEKVNQASYDFSKKPPFQIDNCKYEEKNDYSYANIPEKKTYIKIDITPDPTIIPSHQTCRTNISQSDITIGKQTFDYKHKDNYQKNDKPCKHDSTDFGKVQDELSQLKTHQREQSVSITKMGQKLDNCESNINQQLSKSVERITNEINHVKELMRQTKDIDDQRFDMLNKQIQDIRKYCKKRSKRHSKTHLHLNKDNASSSAISQDASQRQTQQNNKENVPYRDREGYDGGYRETTQFHNSHQTFNGYPRKEEYIATSQPLRQSNIQETYFHNTTQEYNKDSSRQLLKLNKIPSNDIETRSNISRPRQDQYNHYQVTLSNQPNSTVFHSHNHSAYNDMPHKVDDSFYNKEITKVREESQNKISELKDFYEYELAKMREEFEKRELSMKEKMQIQIRESMQVERQRVVEQMQKLQQEKQQMEEVLSNKSKITSPASMTAKESDWAFSMMNNEKTQMMRDMNMTKGNNSITQQEQTNLRFQPAEMTLQPPVEEKQSERKSSKRTLHNQKNQRNLSAHEIKMNSNRKKASKSIGKMKIEKENLLYIPTPLLKNDRLDSKEKDILRRINRIENFLNK